MRETRGCAQPSPTTGYCAFHDWDINTANSSLHLPWVNLPYQPDAGIGCGQTFINTPGTDDGYSITGGHEVMEAITDPIGTGWVDNADTISGGEVADKCAWGGQAWGDSDPAGDVKLATGTFAMQSLWSNAAHGLRDVRRPAAPVTTLGDADGHHRQRGQPAGAPRTRRRAPLTYTASGLPGGLSIGRRPAASPASPNVTAGTFTPR